MTRLPTFAILLVLAACGTETPESSGVQPDGGAQSDGSAQPSGGGATDHIVGADAKTYAEQSEVSNACAVTPEQTAYTVDDVGIVISGTREAANPTDDCFKFNSGSATSVLVRAFVDGTATALPKVQCAGYSSSVVSPETGRAPVTPNLSCTVGLYPKPGDIGTSYTIELKASK